MILEFSLSHTLFNWSYESITNQSLCHKPSVVQNPKSSQALAMEVSFESVGISNGFCEASGGIWCFFRLLFQTRRGILKGI